MDFVKPVVVVSKCLEFDSCRYNGAMIPDPLVEKLKGHVDFLPVCPEVAIGLGVPRKPIRIVADGKERCLVQPARDLDLTDKMTRFVRDYLDDLGTVDGFILKSRSPTCGINNVKVYRGEKKRPLIDHGFFGGEVSRRFSGLAVEDEGRLKNFTIREHFLAKLFLLARFRKVKESLDINQLIKFHTYNKFLLMAQNQSRLKMLGNIVANHKHVPIEEVLDNYEHHLHLAFERPPKFSANINVLEHMYSGISENLSKSERDFFHECVDEYRDERVPLSTLNHLLHSWAIRFDDEYLLGQSFLMPYPKDLVSITDSGKGRDR